ncbi:MAG: hypothetical protein AB8F74_14535 [Saprospiraceae bacterium]
MRKQSLYVLLILILSMISCQGVDSLVNSIAHQNRVDCEAVGYAGSKSNVYNAYKKLEKKATRKELLKLINHDSLAVAGYASYILIDKELIAPQELLKQFIDNTRPVTTFCGCLMSESSISSIIYHKYWNKRISYPTNSDYSTFELIDSKQLQKMDSLILYSDHPDWILLSRALENRIYTTEYNDKIIDWAIDKKNFYALIYVVENLKAGNKERLIKSINEFISNDDNSRAQKEKLTTVLVDLQKQ